MSDKSKEKTATAFSTITPLLGLGTQLATAIPSLRKAPKSNARVSSLPIAQAAMGVAGQGYGADRGGNFLAGLRAAGQAGQQVASQQAQVSAINQQTDFRNREIRNESLWNVGRDVADASGNLAVGLIDSANARKNERLASGGGDFVPKEGIAGQGRGAQNFIGQALQQPPNTQLPKPGKLGSPPPMQDAPQGPPPLDEAAKVATEQAAVLASLEAELDSLGQQEIANKSEALSLTRSALGMPPVDTYVPIAAHVEEQMRMMNIGMETASKYGHSVAMMLPYIARNLGTDLLQTMNPPINPFYDEGDALG